MARVTVEDCLRRVSNCFMLVRAVATRVRQLREGARCLVDSPKNQNIVLALREVAAGRVSVEDGETEHKEADHHEEK